jgi:hypothetical protein
MYREPEVPGGSDDGAVRLVEIGKDKGLAMNEARQCRRASKGGKVVM